jgi:hypothetical protein
MQHLEERRYPELKPTCEHNKDRLIMWANKGYKGNHPKAEFVTGKDEKGNPIIADKPRRGLDKWNSTKRRTEDPREREPAVLPGEEYMAKIKDLWDRGATLLQEVLETPEKIRTETGKKLKEINVEIDNVKNDYIRSAIDKENAKRAPLLAIPAGEILYMVVECTERAIRENKSDLKDDPEVKRHLDWIKNYVSEAGLGNRLMDDMDQAFNYHTQKAVELGADSLERFHARDEFWNPDLLGWITSHYMSSAPSREAPSEWRSAETDSDGMSIDGDEGTQSSTRDSNTPDPNSAAPSGTNATAAEQSASHTTQSQSDESRNSPVSSPPTTDDFNVNYGGVSRAIGGVKYLGIKSGDVPGFSVLVSMKDDIFYHMIASSDVHADSSEPQDYLDHGGYMVGDAKDVKKRLKKGTSIEGKKEHVDGQKFRNFTMSAYAIGARGPESKATKKSPNQYIKGYFKTGEHAGPVLWYTKSKFEEFGSFRKNAVQKMIDTFKNQHNISLQDEVKLEDGASDKWNRARASRAKSSTRHATRHRPRRAYSESESEDDGEDMENESDGSLDNDEGKYAKADPFGFVVPDVPADSGKATRADKSQDIEKMKSGIFDLEFKQTEMSVKLDQMMELIRSLTVANKGS